MVIKMSDKKGSDGSAVVDDLETREIPLAFRGTCGMSTEGLISRKIKVLIRLLYFTYNMKCLLRRVWTLIILGRQRMDLTELSDTEGSRYTSWLRYHLIFRQKYPTPYSFWDSIFCHYIHQEIIAYEKSRLKRNQNDNIQNSNISCTLNQINALSYKNLEEKYHIEREDKDTYTKTWLQFVSRWVWAERYIVGRKRYEDQIRADAQIWFEEFRRMEELKQIEERRFIEVQQTLKNENL